MSGGFLVTLLVLSLALTALPITPARAQPIGVVVDGVLVQFDQPPASIGGRLLVPLRGIFERLGAAVQWNPATNTITAVRGATQVRLTVGVRQALINGSPTTLDVPPLIVRGRTLVPLRFVSEAMGARVDWDDRTRTVYITSAQAQPIAPPSGALPSPPPVALPPSPVLPSPPTPPPSVAVVEGTVLRVDSQSTPPRVLVERGGQIHTFTATPETAIVEVDVSTGREVAVALARIRPGYLVRITADVLGRAIVIRASVRELRGRIDAVTDRQIALADGQTLTLADDVQIFIDGRQAGREHLRPGMEVTLRLHPQTGAVLEAVARAAGRPTPAASPAAPVRIASFGHDALRPLGVGGVVTATLEGTPGGTATFDIAGVASGIPMREIRPGVYQGTYTVRAGDNTTAAAIFGHLRVGGQEAPLVQAGTAVTIDTRPPVIVERVPAADAVISNVRPNILVTFHDQGGSGINSSATRLYVNGQDVTGTATVGDTAVAYSPPDPLADRVIVRIVLADRAGNVTDSQFEFRIVMAQAAPIRSVTVTPARPLRAGEVLRVSLSGDPGGQAAFRIEGLGDWIPMAEVQDQRGTYVGSYTVRPVDRVRNARIQVRLVRDGAPAYAEASTRLTVVAEVVPAPEITAPAAGAAVRAPIVVRGRATPGHQVTVRLDYSGKVLLFDVRGTMGQQTATADASGTWTVTFNQNAPVTDAEITITATAIDQLNRRSRET
ncbi:MAG: copper amine oxidase N-terminal domain-containing protein, partial [Armatimonadota bacterium]|nr:copper amine oxidase N-terminal domain-containing protein [Armatimonadota bacterium]